MKTQAGHFCVALKKLRIKNSKWAGSPSWSICYYFLYKQKVFSLTKGFSYQWYSLFSSSSNLFKDGVTPCVRWYIEYRISFLNPTLASVRSLGKVWKSMISSYFLKIFYPQYLLIVYLRVYLHSGFSKNVVFLKNVSLSMFQIFSVWQTGLQMHHVLSTSGWLYIHYITTWCMHSECMQCNAM